MSWSLTSLGTWEQCGLKYKFRYVDRIKDKPSDQAQRGTDNHALIEGYLKGEIELLPSVLSFYQSFLSGLKLYPIYPEHRIALDSEWKPTAWETAWFRCALDLKLKDGTGIVIYDWKTGKMYDDHYDQKQLYAIAAAAEDEEAKRVRAVHVYLDLNKHTERTYERSELEAARLFWSARVAKMEKDKDFIANPTWKCRFCSYSKHKGGPCQF
jgi:CRISPR/Cas system-associated exonuclease Cas4 (RecB family)